MSSLHREDVTTGVHWLRHPVESIKIKVKLKPTTILSSLLNYNPDDSSFIKKHQIIEEYVFKWQGKSWDVYVCREQPEADTSLRTKPAKVYCEILQEGVTPISRLFAYNHDDQHLVLPLSCVKKFTEQIANLNLGGRCTKSNNPIRSLINRKQSKSQQRLFDSDDSIDSLSEKYTTMHIMFDNNDYLQDTYDIKARKHTCLVCLCYSKKHKYLTVTPEINDLALNPYEVATVEGEHWGYQYSINIDFDDDCADGLAILLTRLQKRWNKRNKNLIYFSGPPVDFRNIYLSFEIISVEDFQLQYLYIQYNVKVYQCDRGSFGRTHKKFPDDSKANHYCEIGHAVDLKLSCLASIEPPPIQIVFEVQSAEYPVIFRTEGYGTLTVPVTAGQFTATLTTLMPEDVNYAEGATRRFFIGGRHLIKDPVLLDHSQSTDSEYSNQEAGTVHLRWSIRTEVGPGLRTVPVPAVGTASSAVLHGAEVAVMRYRLAKAKLQAATKEEEPAEGNDSANKESTESDDSPIKKSTQEDNTTGKEKKKET
ncbi:uncharacterized protein LOC101736053 isoform X2 [Bombyx mori]|uniref:Uncharacterized protein n=1 Tax=Bombyx mori TaxID=7091 RepID=A0A8R2M1P7_BOMMO|nr:uncharacterized protein LOC101736053 isoform X2 [Bombyx mori]